MRNTTNTKKEQTENGKIFWPFCFAGRSRQAKNTALVEHIKKLGLNVSGIAKASA